MGTVSHFEFDRVDFFQGITQGNNVFCVAGQFATQLWADVTQ